jgi:O-antigen/teichoic acid export membrane protein
MKIGLPLIPHSLSGIILAQFDRMAIQSIVGSLETGLYSFAYNIGMIPLVVLGATNSAWVPWFYKQKAQGNSERIRNAVRLFTSGFLIITLGIMVFGPELALIMAPSNYYAGLRIVPIIVLSYFFQFLYTIYVNFAFFKKKTLAISIGTIMAGGLNIALNITLIPIFGYEIAAWTTAISYFCLFIFHWFNVSILLKDKTIPLKEMFVFAIIASVVSLQQYLFNFIFTPFSLYERLIRFGVSSIIIVFLLVYIFNRLKNFFSARESAGE